MSGPNALAANRIATSVIIPAHQAEATIGDQLGALSRQTTSHSFEVLVVCNRCSDNTKHVAESFHGSLPNLRVIEANEKASVTYARNSGWRAAVGLNLLYCDADDVVSENWVESMVLGLADADVVGGRLLPMEPCEPFAKRVRLVTLPDGLPYICPELQYVVGASIGCRRQVVEVLGGFDEAFGGASDDVAFSVAAQRTGFRLGYARDAACRYRLRSSFVDTLRQQRTYGRGVADFVRFMRPSDYLGASLELFLHASKAARSGCTIRSRDDLKVWSALLAYRLGYLGGLWKWRHSADSDLPPSPRSVAELLRRVVDPHLALRWRRPVGASRGSSAEQPALVDFTIPLEWPSVGGYGAVGPIDVVRTVVLGSYRDRISAAVTFSSLIGPGDRVVILGASVGLYSLVASKRVASEGTVISVEADARLQPALLANLRLHSAWTARNRALNGDLVELPLTPQTDVPLGPQPESVALGGVAADCLVILPGSPMSHLGAVATLLLSNPDVIVIVEFGGVGGSRRPWIAEVDRDRIGARGRWWAVPSGAESSAGPRAVDADELTSWLNEGESPDLASVIWLPEARSFTIALGSFERPDRDPAH